MLTEILQSNTLDQAITAAGIFVGVYLLLTIFRRYIVVRLEKLAKKTDTEFDDILIEMIKKLSWPLMLVAALYFGSRYLTLTPVMDKTISYISLAVLVLYLIRMSFVGIDESKRAIARMRSEEEGDSSIIGVFAVIVKIILLVILVLIFLSNIGVNVTSLIAGLGIGGIAIAFALQNILGDIFSSFSILLDKPFKKGDFIIVGSDMGVVDKIGLKSTRIKTLQGQELVMSNRELTSARINNFKQMEKRRIVFKIGVEYSTPSKKLEKIPGMIKEIIENASDKATFDRSHFKEFGDFSFNYETVYYVDVPDYQEYMDIQQKINLDLVKRFEKEGIVFAFPTQTIHLEKSGE
ncbi:MAG: mechanosensitive ion channel family protein [Nanobdellota archaeon]